MISALTDHRHGATVVPNGDTPALAALAGPDA
jgi:hypothetical protein